MGDTAINVLWGAFKDLTKEDGLQRMRVDLPDFNASLLFLLPKKPVRVDPEMGHFYRPEDTGPPMSVDTSNRILAGTLRLKTEPAVGKLVNDCQPVFFFGRSILANIVELEAIM